MTDLPSHVDIHEEGPREGFQIEPGPIATADKVRLIEALAETGLGHIQVCSFVNPRLVPGWADAETVVEGFKTKPGIDYTALWFNASGLERGTLPSPCPCCGGRMHVIDTFAAGTIPTHRPSPAAIAIRIDTS